MKAFNQVKNYETYDVGYLRSSAFREGFLAGKFEVQINTFYELQPDIELNLNCNTIFLSGVNNRTILMDFLRAFGGKWEKSVNEYSKNKMDYIQEVLSDNGEKYYFKAIAVNPPPACRIVEEEVDVPEQIIPAHKKIRNRIVCPEPTTETEKEEEEDNDSEKFEGGAS